MRKMILSAVALAVASHMTGQVTLDIDAAQRGPHISPTHYGIFFEDINHAADGGLYAELIRNRSFEDGPEYGKPADLQAWRVEAPAPSTLQAQLIQPSKRERLLNEAQGHALRLEVNASTAAPARLVNTGYWGIDARQGRTYRLSFWARGKYTGTMTALLLSHDGQTTYASTPVAMQAGKGWTRYTATMTAEANDPQAQFALQMDGRGRVDLDVVSLFPPTFKNRENGLRPDLAQMLYELHPKFMRFPGGCFVEGQVSPDNAFRWERTIGPIEERPGHWNVNWGYRTTDGIGFHEYLQMAEDLGAKPLYVVNVGLWHGGLTPVDSLQPWIDETLAALEYANGDVSTHYGALRAKNGHPAPFNIEYLEIGNENNQPDARQQSDRYYDRYCLFRKAVLEKYPKMKIIGNVAAWGTDEPTWDSNEAVDLLDEHYYRNPGWFADNFHKYDSYDRRGPKIYVGEYAVTSGFGDLGNLNAALGEAVFMMGMENNSDIVPMNSYAPIFVNENDARWRPDMIRFNSHRVMGTPSYYVQALMAGHVGTQVVPVRMSNPYEAAARQRAVTPKRNRTGVGTWGTRASFAPAGQMQPLSGSWETRGEVYAQTSLREQCVAVEEKVIDSDHYTVRYRARKDDGAEGFLIVFNYVDPQHYCWLNLGGWGNTQHAIEQIAGSGKIQTATREGKVETGRWYDITLTVSGDSVRAWMDQDLVFDTVLKHDTSLGVFASATIDEKTGELIVKIVNTQEEATTADIRLQHFRPASAHVVRLTSLKGEDENTLDSPTAIVPTRHELSPQGSNVAIDLPAFSLCIVRIQPE